MVQSLKDVRRKYIKKRIILNSQDFFIFNFECFPI